MYSDGQKVSIRLRELPAAKDGQPTTLKLIISVVHFLPNNEIHYKSVRVCSFCQIILLFRVIQSSAAMWRMNTILI